MYKQIQLTAIGAHGTVCDAVYLYSMNAPTFPAPSHLQTLSRSARNGYLFYVSGEIIAAGSNSLPPPSPSEVYKPERHVEVEVPNLGTKMCLTYVLNEYRHHKTRTWAWTVVRADFAPTPL